MANAAVPARVLTAAGGQNRVYGPVFFLIQKIRFVWRISVCTIELTILWRAFYGASSMRHINQKWCATVEHFPSSEKMSAPRKGKGAKPSSAVAPATPASSRLDATPGGSRI